MSVAVTSVEARLFMSLLQLTSVVSHAALLSCLVTSLIEVNPVDD